MLSSNARLTKADLIRPLSPEALEYFASGVIPVSERDKNTLKCKFIRLGETVMIGAAIHYGTNNWTSGEPKFVKHVDLLDELQRTEALYKPASARLQDEPTLGRLPLHDAGMAVILAINAKPIELSVIGSSYDYGRADDNGRQRTVEVAQALVGSETMVIAV